MSITSDPLKNKEPTAYHTGYVSIIGRPNVGKSTLINQILLEKIAIVSDKPQTTRNRIMGVRTCPSSQIIFWDTPGIHKPKFNMNRRMVKTALGTLEEVDLILFLVEASKKRGGGDQYIMDLLKEIKTPIFLVINKVDLVSKQKLLPFIQDYSQPFKFSEVIPVSALSGDNVEHLIETITPYLPKGKALFPEDMLTDQPMRFIAAEMIREKILIHTREEIPYSVAVGIEEYSEDPQKNLISIQAIIYVDRESQKGIIIGKGGALLKTVGTEARLDLERLVACRVFVQLWVKVKKGWRGSDTLLTELGY